MLQILLLTFIISNVENVSTTHNIPNDIVILHSDEKGLSFQYSYALECLQQKQIIVDGDEYYIFDIKNTIHSNPPGTFDVPSKEVIIGIPQKGDIHLSTYVNFETKINNIKIAPVPYKTFEGLLDYQIQNKINFDIYPSQRVQLKSIEYFRDIRIARIKIYPIQYNYLTKEVNIANDIIISIQFSQAAQINSKSDYFDGIFKDIMLNGEQAINWKLQEDKILNNNTDYSKYPIGFTNWYKVKIESTGVYKISYNELRQAGLPVNIIDPRTIRLFNIGDYVSNIYYPDTMIEIPLYVAGEDDSLFDQKDYILFYGISPSRYNNINRTTFYNNPFTRYNYYWLTWGISAQISGFGKRIETINAISSGNRKYYAENYVHLEVDRDCPARNGLLWIWDLFSKPRGSFSKEFNVLLDIISPESLINLKGRMYACSTSNWLKIGINNLQLDSFTFPGYYTNPPPFNFEINKRIPLLESNILRFQLYNFS
ncbi:MAG: C25 family peptidase propeptide domain-containing protein, partial [candidate division WOR-3 bacterium]